MKNRQTVQYALMCLQELDGLQGRPCSPADVSRRCGMPLPECVDVLQKLAGAGLVEKDDAGNFRLRGPLCDLTALDVLTALAAPVSAKPRFKMRVGQDRGPAVRKTLEAVSRAELAGVYPSENGLA